MPDKASTITLLRKNLKMTDTVHGLTKATYRETLRGLQNDALRLAYNGRPSPGMISLEQLEAEIARVQGILDTWMPDNES